MKRKAITLDEIRKRFPKKIDGGTIVWLSLDENKKILVHFLLPGVAMKKLQEKAEEEIAKSTQDLDIGCHFLYDKKEPIGPSIPIYDLVVSPNIEGLKKIISEANEKPEDIAKILEITKKVIKEYY